METIENNKLIAEFMGINKISINVLRNAILNDLQYHSDWNELMEVVDKVYSSDIYYDKYIEHNSSMFSSGKIKLSVNIDHVYKQIVEFIKWYNQNNQ